jgi:hypothetical protein
VLTPQRLFGSCQTATTSSALLSHRANRPSGRSNAEANYKKTLCPENQAKAAPSVINGRINGRYAKGFSGNPGGSPEATRRGFNKDFLVALARDSRAHGEQVLARVRRESPAAYLKVCAMLVPRELKIEHTGGVKATSDEELERGIEMITTMLAARDAGASARVIDAVPVPVALPAPSCKPSVERRRSQRHHPNDSEPVCQQRVVAPEPTTT